MIGLTGQTGAGKSTVCGILLGRGFVVIDADVVARQVVEKGRRCLVDLAVEFGVEILEADGSLNRRRLGAMVFSHREKRRRLNRIIFPYIREEIEHRIEDYALSGATVLFLDAPTLFESGSESYCDKVVSVVAPRDIRLRRLLDRDSRRTMEEIENRIDAQHGDDYYASRSDFVIVNDGDLSALRVQVLEMLEYCCRGVRRPDAEQGP